MAVETVYTQWPPLRTFFYLEHSTNLWSAIILGKLLAYKNKTYDTASFFYYL